MHESAGLDLEVTEIVGATPEERDALRLRLRDEGWFSSSHLGRWMRWKPLPTIDCAACGAPFAPKGNRKVYCSYECNRDVVNKKSREWYYHRAKGQAEGTP